MRPRVDIYDAVNTDRLLGSIPRPSGPVCGRAYEVALSPRTRVMLDVDPFTPVEIFCARFTYQMRSMDDGWSAVLVFLTDAPLSLLMTHPKFRLPGETERQAEERVYWS